MTCHAMSVIASALGCDVKPAVLPASLRTNASIKDRKTIENSILPIFARMADGDTFAPNLRCEALH